MSRSLLRPVSASFSQIASIAIGLSFSLFLLVRPTAPPSQEKRQPNPEHPPPPLLLVFVAVCFRTTSDFLISFFFELVSRSSIAPLLPHSSPIAASIRDHLLRKLLLGFRDALRFARPPLFVYYPPQSGRNERFLPAPPSFPSTS